MQRHILELAQAERARDQLLVGLLLALRTERLSERTRPRYGVSTRTRDEYAAIRTPNIATALLGDCADARAWLMQGGTRAVTPLDRVGESDQARCHTRRQPANQRTSERTSRRWQARYAAHDRTEAELSRSTERWSDCSIDGSRRVLAAAAGDRGAAAAAAEAHEQRARAAAAMNE